MRERNDSELSSLFESVLRKEVLLPKALEAQWQNLEVYDSLRVKGRADVANFDELKSSTSPDNKYEEFLKRARPFHIQNITMRHEEPIFLMDKLTPHALYDLMMMSASHDRKCSIMDHSYQTRQSIFSVMSKFASYAQLQNLYPYLCFNYDPHTFDRESGQSEKRFHVHLIGRTKDELAEVSEHAQKVKDLPPLRMRRLIDETTIISSLIAYDYFATNDTFKSMQMIKPMNEGGGPFFEFELHGGWASISTKEFDSDFSRIHTGLCKLYDTFLAITTVGISGQWMRPELLPSSNLKQGGSVEIELRNMQWLSEQSREAYLFFINALKPSLMKKGALLRNSKYRDITTHIFPLAGLCYTVAFFESNQRVYMLIKSQVFSDLGAAGLEKLDGIATKIKRGVGVFDESELAKRRAFQKDFARYIT